MERVAIPFRALAVGARGLLVECNQLSATQLTELCGSEALVLTQGATQLSELCGGDEVNSFHLSTWSRPSAILLEKQGSGTTIHDSDDVDDVI